jgi:hypothetical protein
MEILDYRVSNSYPLSRPAQASSYTDYATATFVYACRKEIVPFLEIVLEDALGTMNASIDSTVLRLHTNA